MVVALWYTLVDFLADENAGQKRRQVSAQF